MKPLRDVLLPGVKVKCIVDTDVNITKDRIYTIISNDDDHNDISLILRILDDKNEKVGKYAHKFVMVKDNILDDRLFEL